MMTLLLVAVILSAGAEIRFEHTRNRKAVYFFKPLTTLLIIGLCLSQTPEISDRYRILMAGGLFFSLFGDVFLMLPSDKFIQGLLSFFVAHVLYMTAFISAWGWSPSLWVFIPVFIYGVFLLGKLLPHTGKMTIPVVIYAGILLFLLWQAGGQAAEFRIHSTRLALAGTLLFVASDSILAVNRFASPVKNARSWIMATYFSAQILLALSVSQG